MYLFTYKEYLRCTKPRAIYELREESTEYNLNIEQEKTHQYKDKIFKEILSNKKEVINFLKKYFKDEIFEKLTENDIEKYNKEFITSRFEKQEADIVYQIPKENLYIIIEHQSKVDYNMPERMTKYCIELRRDIRKSSKKWIEPDICPIVLYTGHRKWNVPNEKEVKRRFIMEIFQCTKYNFVDINNEIEENLVKEDTGMSKALLFERINSKEELKKAMIEILKKNLTKEEKEYIAKMLKYSNKIREIMPEERKDYIRKLEKGENEEMRFEKYFIEWLEEKEMEGEKRGEIRGEKRGEKRGEIRGEKRGEKIGIAKAIKQMVKEMLQKQMSDKDIMDITKIDEKELQKLKMA